MELLDNFFVIKLWFQYVSGQGKTRVLETRKFERELASKSR